MMASRPLRRLRPRHPRAVPRVQCVGSFDRNAAGLLKIWDRLLGKIVGRTYLITCLVCLIRPKAVLEASKSIAEDPGLLLVSGIFTMAGGVATVIGHNVWSGGFLLVSVTVLGWMMLAKGLALMVVPPEISNFPLVLIGDRRLWLVQREKFDLPYRPAWIRYLCPALAQEAKPPAGAIVEYLPNGGVSLSATEQTFDVENPQHIAVAEEIAATLAGLPSLTMQLQ